MIIIEGKMFGSEWFNFSVESSERRKNGGQCEAQAMDFCDSKPVKAVELKEIRSDATDLQSKEPVVESSDGNDE